jgi:hypothetical protein
MNNADISQRIEKSRDSVGVVTADAIHNQLNSFTPADWKQAASIYSQHDAAPNNGFWIDDKNGQVTIHNNLEQAQKYSQESVVQASADYLKNYASLTVGMTASEALLVGGLMGAIVASDTGLAAGVAAGVTIGVAALPWAATVTGAIMGSLAVEALAESGSRKWQAMHDLSDDAVSFQS